MNKKKVPSVIMLYLGDLVFLNTSYFLLNFIIRHSWQLQTPYFKLFLLINFLWFFIAIWSPKRLDISNISSYSSGALNLGRYVLYMVYVTSLVIVIMGLSGFSRRQVYGTFVLYYMFELIGLYFARPYFKVKSESIVESRLRESFSYLLAFLDYIVFLIVFFLIYYFKTGTFKLNPSAIQILLILTGLWIITAGWTGKFSQRYWGNIYYTYSAFIKSAVIMAALMAILVFSFRLFYYSRMQIFGSLLGLLVFEFPMCLLHAAYAKSGRNGSDIETVDEVQHILQQELKLPEKNNGKVRQPAYQKLEDIYLKDYPQVLEFIDKNINLKAIDIRRVRVLDTHTLYNIQTLDNKSLKLFVNLHQVNDFRRINRYFLEVHKKFINGGYFVGYMETLESYRKRFFNHYPPFMAKFLYSFYFFYTRVCPKIPILKNVYFTFSQGKNRHISKAELLGRLSFCGFRVLKTKSINDKLFFIAQKVKTPSAEKNPSYGPFITLRRVGYKGKTIHIKKLRTMYPYSEFIQDYVFEQNRLAENGKFRDDFRVTEWGKVFRKLWLDELPQLINFIRGDIGLIGVRALSHHYFNLYPEDLQKLRIQFKPGLIPPYYADLPKSFDEIVESERRYLEAKLKHPLRTDVIYFTKAIYNIIFKNARSR